MTAHANNDTIHISQEELDELVEQLNNALANIDAGGSGLRVKDGQFFIDRDMDFDCENNINDIKDINFCLESENDGTVEGKVNWNQDDHTLNISTGDGPVLQAGQEMYLPFSLAKNDTGDTLQNGKVVFLCNSNGQVCIELANNKEQDVIEKTVGITTQPIDDQDNGYVTTYGLVRDIDTSSWEVGDTLYVDEIDGELINTRPTGGNFIIPIAEVLEKGTNGSIFVKYLQIFDPADTKDVNGFPNQGSSQVNQASRYIFNDGTLEFTIRPNTENSFTEYYYFGKGIKYVKNSADTVTIPDETGVYYFYFDEDELKYFKNPTSGDVDQLIRLYVLIAGGYYDSSNSEMIFLGNERHGFKMSSDTHSYLHFTQGAKWLQGLAMSDVIANGDGSLDTHAQFGTESGVTTDEDLTNIISTIGSTVGLPMYYLENGATSHRIYNSGFSVLDDITAGVGVTGRLVYNDYDGGVWSLKTVANGDYVLCHVFSTNDIDQPVIAFIGQADYGNIITARSGAETEISTILTNFPAEEIIPLATFIFQTGNGYTNSVKARIRTTDIGESYVDWRTSEGFVAGAPPTDHPNLSGLTWTGSGHTGDTNTLAGFGASGEAITTTIDLSPYVPYTEATSDVDLGLFDLTATDVNTDKLFAVDGTVANANITVDAGIISGLVDATSSISVLGDGSFAVGKSINGGTIEAEGKSPYLTGFNGGSFAQGSANGGTIRAYGIGCFAQGATSSGGKVENYGLGNFAQGYAGGGKIGSNSSLTKGSFAQGRTAPYCNIIANDDGAFAQGFTNVFGNITSTNRGSFAQGYGYGSSGKVSSENKGSFAQGVGYNGDISSKGRGSFCQGIGYYNTIETSADGAFAQGKAQGGYIKATNVGSFAQGNANTGNILSNASNAAQFGPGTNSQADSLQVGSQVRIKGTLGAPTSSKHNGDIWVNGNYVYVRSNNTDIKITGPGPLTN